MGAMEVRPNVPEQVTCYLNVELMLIDRVQAFEHQLFLSLV